jgi:hypothetical protein
MCLFLLFCFQCLFCKCMVKALSSLTMFFCVLLIPIVSILSYSLAKVVSTIFLFYFVLLENCDDI